ncbi:uncharacterized protein CDAR_457931 [Caerostris darwini]|uniref:Uncharacterized protein n=1 Tax=Caerostris darwini TaxID=1538125 RepID=A0AAV4V8I3_9ARAC|nr:uncharacterized protein CDAR_457931 [Caerostris darwini]
MDDVREVKLKRSDSIGLGFSVFGGKGSEFPPVIYQVVDESPAAVSGVNCLCGNYYILTPQTILLCDFLLHAQTLNILSAPEFESNNSMSDHLYLQSNADLRCYTSGEVVFHRLLGLKRG